MMKLGFKSLGGSILASVVVVNLGAFGVSGYIKVNTDFSTFSFGGLDFTSLDDLIEYLKKLINDLFVACKLNSDDKSFLERLRKAKSALDEAQKLKVKAKKVKNFVLKRLEKLRKASRHKDDNSIFNIDWENREDVRAYEKELWEKAYSKGIGSITYKIQDVFDKIVAKSGFFNYVFRVKDFSIEPGIWAFKSFAYLNLDDNGLELVFSGGVGHKERVSFLEEGSEEKIKNLFKKINLLNCICNNSADRLEDRRKKKFYINSADKNGFEFKEYGSSSFAFKINERDLVASVASCADDGKEQKFDMTKLEDLEVLVGKML